MPKAKLNTHLVSHVSCPEGKRKETFFDTVTKGLSLEVRVSGGKTYYLRYSDVRSKTRYMKLADASDVSLTEARKLCEQARNKIAMGKDPISEKAVKRNVPTFRAFVQERYLPYVKTYKASWKTDETLLRVHLIPAFGSKHLDEITKDDVIKFRQAALRTDAKPGSINRRLILLRYIFNLAVRDWEVPGVPSNPTNGVALLPENNKKERYITEDELKRLYDAVKRSKNVMLRYILPLLVVTGARRGEVLNAKWEDIDLDRRMWRIPKAKSGQARYIPLGENALRVLDTVQGISRSDYPFGNPKTGKPYRHLYSAWHVARERAGLPEVRMHDLRHSFASFLINEGRGIYEVQKLLGHTQIKTTQRYAHLTQKTLLEAADAGTASLTAIFNP
ncbi:site-specific integrase [Sulfitobacter dubius]|uniref:site-specific integrase n=1 Tax=Sulfitobacter dubius TaxID=218673 RepID=UPI0022AE8D6A|nr:site-specific integrase [Sulfitobacter dubius]MCZ4368781.1 tyrosine-type recombinase/integrase [Sulfitobacter dubius]